MNNTQLKELPDILEELVFDEEPAMGLEGEVEKRVAEKMPDYTIYTWNADTSGVLDFAEEYTSIIGGEIEQGHQIEDIQYSEWISDDNTVVLVVIAIKTK